MRRLVLGLVAAATLAGASAANATLYVGNTFGCFGAACSPVGGVTANYSGLTFNTTNFTQADAGGVAHIGGAADNNFGTFTLIGTPTDYGAPPTLFTLLITFTQPAGATGANTFSSMITGVVTGDNAGGVFIDFDNTAHLYTSPSGNFLVSLNDFDVSSGGIATQITGRITAVPEPATWGMMLVGFAGIGMTLRRRRRPALAQLA
jgi:hypothetical protein